MQLELSAHDAKVLSESLESTLGELRYEINDTDKADYRDELRGKLKVLERIAAALAAG